MSLTSRTYLLLCLLMSHYALMDIKYSFAKQPAGNSFQGKERRKCKTVWSIRFTSHLSDKLLLFYRHIKQNLSEADLDLLYQSVKLNKMNMYKRDLQT